MKKQIRQLIRIIAAAAAVLGGLVCAVPINAFAADNPDYTWPVGPEISADSAIVMEANTGLILYEKNIYARHYPASTTKVLTTLVALENSELSDTVTVSYEADNYVSKTSSRMGLTEGEQLSMEEALYGIMLESANEATYAVGEQVAGSVGRYVKMMNAKAKALGCVNSNFVNTHGLHDSEHYTCAYDLAIISRAAMANPVFAKITATSTYSMPATNKSEARLLTNHHWFINKTMRYDYCIGGKTGSTSQAKNCLTTYAKKNGMTLICAVMYADGWPTVYNETKTLLDYCFENYSLYNISDAEVEDVRQFPSLFRDVDMFGRSEDRIFYMSDTGSIILPNGVDYKAAEKEVVLESGREIEHGENLIGHVEYTFGGRVVGNVDILYYNRDYPITAGVFREEWPDHMIPLEVAFANVDRAEKRRQGEKTFKSMTSGSDEGRFPMILGITSGSVVLLAGLTLMLVKTRRRK